jgi:hypothetical protein
MASIARGSKLSAVSLTYLALAILGLCATWTYNTLWMLQVQRAITLQEFVAVGFQGSRLLGSLASDFWVGSLAAVTYMIVEGRRIALPRLWLYIVLTFVIAWAFAFPLFLFMRERYLGAQMPARAGATPQRATAR